MRKKKISSTKAILFGIFLFGLFIFLMAYSINTISKNPEVLEGLPFPGFFLSDASQYVEYKCLKENFTFEDGWCIMGNSSDQYIWELSCEKNLKLRTYYNESILEFKLPEKTQEIIDRRCSSIKYLNQNWSGIR